MSKGGDLRKWGFHKGINTYRNLNQVTNNVSLHSLPTAWPSLIQVLPKISSSEAKLSVYWSIDVPVLIHELWVVTERIRLRIQSGRVQSLIFHIERRQLRCFGYLTMMLPGQLLGEVFWRCPTGRKTPQWVMWQECHMTQLVLSLWTDLPEALKGQTSAWSTFSPGTDTHEDWEEVFGDMLLCTTALSPPRSLSHVRCRGNGWTASCLNSYAKSYNKLHC